MGPHAARTAAPAASPSTSASSVPPAPAPVIFAACAPASSGTAGAASTRAGCGSGSAFRSIFLFGVSGKAYSAVMWAGTITSASFPASACFSACSDTGVEVVI